MSNSFSELGISPPILTALEEMGFEIPTEVQSRAIPPILAGKDMIVKSKTGSGKTAVFGIPILQLTNPEETGPQGLILTPTRELAVQVDNDLKKMAKHLKHKTTAVYGQHSMNVEIQALEKGVTILTGTPGRVYDHISNGKLNTRHIKFLVLDEADRMLDMGFVDQVVKIIRTLPRDRVTLLFSATIPPEIKRICNNFMRQPETVEIESPTKTVDTIQQIYYRVEPNEKRTQLNRLLLLDCPESCMIFCNTRVAVDQVQSFLSRKGYASAALHGDIPQGKRLKTIQQFKQGDLHLLVATDVAARGIHIEGLSLVVNYDVPNEKDSYVHRIGRTGRAGNDGRAITLVTSDDIMSLYEIEEHIGVMIEEGQLPPESALEEKKEAIDLWLGSNEEKLQRLMEASQSSGQSSRKRSRKRPQGEKASGTQASSSEERHIGSKPAQPKQAQDGGRAHGKGQRKPRPEGSGAAGRPPQEGAQSNGRHDTRQHQHRSSQSGSRPNGGPARQSSNRNDSRRDTVSPQQRTPRNGSKPQDKPQYAGKRPYPTDDTRKTRDMAAAGSMSSRSDTARSKAAINTKPETCQEPAQKKSLFKRLLGRILGK